MRSPYPKRLVPSKINLLNHSPKNSDILCRRVNPDRELKIDNNKLHPDAVFLFEGSDYKHVFDYSVNKVPESEVEDVLIQFKDKVKFNKLWQIGMDGIMPIKEEFYFQAEKLYFLFMVKDVVGLSAEFPFNRVKPKAEIKIKYVLELQHVPTISNFCHYQLKVNFLDPKTGQSIENTPSTSSAFMKVVASDIRQKLVHISKFEISEFN